MSDQLKTLQDLENEISSRYTILYKAYTFFGDLAYLINPRTSEERSELDQNPFIRKISYSMWVVAVLEMSKLFGKKSDDYDLKKLLNKLCQCLREIEWDRAKGHMLSEKYLSLIEQLDIIYVVKKMKGVRDEYYVRSDKYPSKTIEEFSPDSDQFNKLLIFSYEALHEISNELISMNLARVDRIHKLGGNILTRLSEHKKGRMSIYSIFSTQTRMLSDT